MAGFLLTKIMSKSPAFQFYAADFMIGIMGMTDEEVGIYIKMLSTQWLHGSLPNCKKTIKKMINSRKVPSEMVMRKFSISDDGFLRNERMEKVREKQKSFIETRKENANKRWNKPENENALAMHVHDGSICKTDALHLHSSSSSSRVLSKDNTLRNCEEIYDLYPLKVGKKAGIDAIMKALKKTSKEVLIEAVTAYAAAKKIDPSFTANPATWFNQERWLDDRAAWQPKESKQMTFGVKTQSRDDRHPNELKETIDITILPVWDAMKDS
jgi:uncharacterized protein YdaU (DUF1376 family)